MKRIILCVMLVFLPFLMSGQVYIDLEQLNSVRNVRLRCTLQDSKSGEPIPYATAYLIPQGDTTITYFALSDENGKVKIDDITPGKYVFNAEMVGYLPYKKVYELKGWEKDLEIIRLEENPEYIDASTITALGNPINISKDTLIYNASAFPVGESAMLEDLLKKMPGMEVAPDGTVTVNGEKVEKITVGGKTFFFNDPAMAVKNLPAKIVDKIKVMDKKTDEAQLSGVSAKSDKEKVMDIQLKEEYKKGVFGNVRLYGGSSLLSESDRTRKGQDGLLFNGSSLLASYNDRDQLTVIGNGSNAAIPGQKSNGFYMIDNNAEYDELNSKAGLETNAQAGANVNTSRIKNAETNFSVSYSYNQKDAREDSRRTSFQSSGSDIVTDSDYLGIGDSHKVSAAFQIQSPDNSERVMYYIRPNVSYTDRDREISNSSSTESDGNEMNRSAAVNTSHSGVFIQRTEMFFGIKDLGKKNRTLVTSGYCYYRNLDGSSVEMSETDYVGYSDRRHLMYDNRESRFAIDGNIAYGEPVGEKWIFQTRVSGSYTGSISTKDAFNGGDGTKNDYYSAFSDRVDRQLSEWFLLGSTEESGNDIQLGIQLNHMQNATVARSMGKESSNGQGEWLFNWSPFISAGWSRESDYVGMFMSGWTQTPNGMQTLPTLALNNPVQASAGNIYLKPSFSQHANVYGRRSNKSRFSFLNFGLSSDLTVRQIVSASWFDDSGNGYSIPVNSPRPSFNLSANMSYSTPIDKDRRLSLNLDGSLMMARNISYQAKGHLPGMNKDSFDYDELMSWFWGNPDGDLFYGGKSGFDQSRTTTARERFKAGLKYRRERFSADISSTIVNRNTRYTLNPEADVNTRDYYFNAEMLYTSDAGWEFSTDGSYGFFRGYLSGYGEPELIWNAGVSKSVKSVTLSFKAADILNQQRGLQRNATDNYVEDIHKSVMGRYFLFGVSFNFGKMNSKNNDQARNAMMNMLR